MKEYAITFYRKDTINDIPTRTIFVKAGNKTMALFAVEASPRPDESQVRKVEEIIGTATVLWIDPTGLALMAVLALGGVLFMVWHRRHYGR